MSAVLICKWTLSHYDDDDDDDDDGGVVSFSPFRLICRELCFVVDMW